VSTPRSAAQPGTTTAAGAFRAARFLCALSLGLLVSALSGCAAQRDWVSGTWDRLVHRGPPPTIEGPADSLVLRGNQLERDSAAAASAVPELDGARELYRRGEYDKAQRLFAQIARNTKNTLQVSEEALYYEADCQRMRGNYRDAAHTYNKLLTTFASGRYGEQARQRLFDIANFWLDDTRDQMEANREKREGKRWVVWPASYVHFDKTKPFLDEEGHALRMLEQVYLTNPTGPLAEKALFYIGSVKFFREDYEDADHFFHQVVTHHPHGKLAPKAVELCIFCKLMATGGSEYDGRKVHEARGLIDRALKTYPELASTRQKFLTDQLYAINQHQADKDYKIAEFYQRTGHPGSAYFYYEIVRRRYPGTKYAERATKNMEELRSKLDKSATGQDPSANPSGAIEVTPGLRPPVPGTPLMAPEGSAVPRPLPPSLSGER
jgi:outer membrane protein assembly factor BamD (BamD/ComL family)